METQDRVGLLGAKRKFRLKISSKTLVEVASLLFEDVLVFVTLARRHQVKENRL
jgi:hypothetical protein